MPDVEGHLSCIRAVLVILKLELFLLQVLLLFPSSALNYLVDDHWLVTNLLPSSYAGAYLLGIVPRTPWDPRVIRRVDVPRELTEQYAREYLISLLLAYQLLKIYA